MRLAGEHRAVAGGQLVGQGFNLRGVHPDMRVEEVRKPDAKRLRGEPVLSRR